MRQIYEIFESLRRRTGNAQINALQASLNQLSLEKSNILKEVLLYTYNPHNKYKINESKYNKLRTNKCTEEFITIEGWYDFKHHLDYLSQQKSAKDSDVETTINLIEQWSQECQEFLKCILYKDLKLNMSIKKFQKIWYDFCVQPQVQLANEYEGNDFIKGYYSRKFDGKRMYIMDGIAYSRGNIKCKQEPIQHILDNIPEEYKFDYVFDGECIYFDSNGNENFQKAISLTNSLKRTSECENICYVIFDVIPKKSFITKTKGFETFEEELKFIKDNFWDKTNESSPCISLLPTYYKHIFIARQEDSKEPFTEVQRRNNWEGLMYRNAYSSYEYKRSNNLLKVKQFKDAEYEVIDLELGKKPMAINQSYVQQYIEQEKIDIPKDADCNFMIEIPCVASLIFKHKGCFVKCGSGFSDEQRISWYKNPTDIVGHKVKIKYFEETINKQGEISLRFPTFLCFRDNEETL